eukprot:319555_1
MEGLIEITNGKNEQKDDIDYEDLLKIKLGEQKLTHILDEFIKLEMTVSDLLVCNENELREIIDNDIKKNNPKIKISSIQKIKFIRTVIDIKNMKNTVNVEEKNQIKKGNMDLKRILEIINKNESKIKLETVTKIIERFPTVDISSVINAANQNNIILDNVLETMSNFNEESINFQRVIEAGPNAVAILETILKYRKTFNNDAKNELIQDTKTAADQELKKFNKQYESILNELANIKQLLQRKTEFYRDLYIQQNILNHDAEFIKDFSKCIANTTQSKDEIAKQLKILNEKIEKSKSNIPEKQGRYSWNDKLELYCHTDKVKEIFSISHRKIMITLKPMKLKCVGVNGNVVSLEWDAKPLALDPIFPKLLEINEFQESRFSVQIQYTSNDVCDEKKDENENSSMRWKTITIEMVYLKNEDKRNEHKDIKWQCKRKLYLKQNTLYQIRALYVYSKVGSSELGNVITINTLPERLSTEISKYEAVWSNKHRSTQTKVSNENAVITSIQQKQCARFKYEIKKGTKVMWELLSTTSKWNPSVFGVVCSTKIENDECDMIRTSEFAIKGLYGISRSCSCNNGHHHQFTSVYPKENYWIDNFNADADVNINSIKIIADYTTNECKLLYIVNGLILTGDNETYSMKIHELKDDEHLYPCITLDKDGDACKIVQHV